MPDVRQVRLTWSGERMRFSGEGTEPESPAVIIDGDSAAGPSPMQVLLLSAAGCTGADVVVMLKKMRVDLQELSIDVVGTRRDEHPKRYTAITYRIRMRGEGLDHTKAKRAVDLSLEKYCSVVHSFAPDIAVDYEIELD
ncbi:MAG: OsmC family protein [Gemmatimonadales bacterium]|jgi:putative redox protein